MKVNNESLASMSGKAGKLKAGLCAARCSPLSARPAAIRFFAALLLAAQCAACAGWPEFDAYHGTITREQFIARLRQVHDAAGAFDAYLVYGSNDVAVFSTPARTGAPLLTLKFAAAPESARPLPRTFKRAADLARMPAPPNRPLAGIRIALDPGHIGGEWARMEERWFIVGRADRQVQEAVLARLVAMHLKKRLEAAGAEVVLTSDGFEPVTDFRPEDFRDQAEREIAAHPPRFAGCSPLEREAGLADAVRKRQELLFFRNAEIRARAEKVNMVLHPDLTLCIHFNAVEWGPDRRLAEENRLLFFLHGQTMAGEMEDDAQKRRLLFKLLEQSHPVEKAVAEAVADHMVEATGLPPVEYWAAPNVAPNPDHAYVFYRNLAANRLFDGPVVYLEPYFQNSRDVYRRIQAGDYEGLRTVEGRLRKSIYREYADSVADGVIEAYSAFRAGPAAGANNHDI
ncbi:MAG: hypothetical protein GX608_04290 [Lentisphaerae bacterium]|nr:hypothetical protein [Lentisphaerota bacterium]